MAFDVLDKDGSGVVTIEDVAAAYDTSKHPEVMEGAKTSEEVLKEFMSQWDTLEKDGIVTKVRWRVGARVCGSFGGGTGRCLTWRRARVAGRVLGLLQGH